MVDLYNFYHSILSSHLIDHFQIPKSTWCMKGLIYLEQLDYQEGKLINQMLLTRKKRRRLYGMKFTTFIVGMCIYQSISIYL